MKRWLVALALAAGLSAEAQPLTGGLLGRGASYSTFVPPAGCASGYVPYFNADLDLVCSPTVWNPATRSLDVTDGRVQAGNIKAIPLPASGAVTVAPRLSPLGGITVVAGSALVDGDSLSVGDGVGVIPIEFDASPGDGTTGGAVPIVFDGAETATQIRDAVKAILDASGRDWITSNQGADGIGLVRATPGASGGAITEAVSDAGFTVTDWTDPTHATTYTYSLQACLADGTCNAAGAASSTAAGVLTLSAYNLNRLSWSAVSGAASYKIRRDVGGATQGVIWSGTALTADDTGLAGDSTAKPTVNGTGVVTAEKVLAGSATLGGEAGTSITTRVVITPDTGTDAYAPLSYTSEHFTIGRSAESGASSGGLYFSYNSTHGFAAIGALSPNVAWRGIFLNPGGNSVASGIVTGPHTPVGWSSSATNPAGLDTILTRGAAATLQLGAANAASPVAQTLKFQDATGTNANAAATATVKGPAGTGTGTPGVIKIQTAQTGTSGSTAHSQADRLTIGETYVDTNIGTGTAVARVGGVLHVSTTSQATTGTAEEVLATYRLPANTLSANGKAIRITAWGTTAANGNNKTARIRFGGIAGTNIALGTFSTNDGGWEAVAVLVRTGASTQTSAGTVRSLNSGTTVGLATTQTMSNAIDIVVTGTTATSAGDLTFRGLLVEALN